MTTGIFTPTEGAIAACVWSLILGLLWYRTLTLRMFVKVCLDTVETTEGNLMMMRDLFLIRPYHSPHLATYPEDAKA